MCELVSKPKNREFFENNGQRPEIRPCSPLVMWVSSHFPVILQNRHLMRENRPAKRQNRHCDRLDQACGPKHVTRDRESFTNKVGRAFICASPDMPRSCLVSLHKLRHSTAQAPSRHRTSAENRAQSGRLAIFAVVSTHEQTKFCRTAIALGGHLSGVSRSHPRSTKRAHAPEAPDRSAKGIDRGFRLYQSNSR